VLKIYHGIMLGEHELHEQFVHASGPGGQNVNKVATAVRLRFNVLRTTALPEYVRTRLVALAGTRMTTGGELIIVAQRFRTQARNRADARDRLVALIRAAARRPKPRKKTQPTVAAKQRRIDGKRHRSHVKRMRSTPAIAD
jgi:ribosome-associated protein